MFNFSKSSNQLLLKLKMGNGMSHEKLIEKITPKKVCPDEIVREIKKKHLERIKDLVTTEWKYVKPNPNHAEFHISIHDCRLVENEYREVYIKDNHCEKVPIKYKNGFDVIVTYEEVVSIIRSIVSCPHIIKLRNQCVYDIYLVLNN